MGEPHLRAVLDDPGRDASATDALLDLLASEDAEALAVLQRASRHVVIPDREPSALRQILSRRSQGQRYSYEEVEAAIYEVALELLPESWAASRERLRLRVEGRSKTTPIARKGKRTAADDLTPEDAIAHLLVEDTACLREVASLSLYPLLGGELTRVTRLLWRALRGRGHHYQGRYFSDHLYAVVRDLFPSSPGAEWSEEWANAIALAAINHVASQKPPGSAPVNTDAVERAVAEVEDAGAAEDRRAYRRAVRSWVDGMLAPFEDA